MLSRCEAMWATKRPTCGASGFSSSCLARASPRHRARALAAAGRLWTARRSDTGGSCGDPGFGDEGRWLRSERSAGMRALVTRPREEAEALAAALTARRARGADRADDAGPLRGAVDVDLGGVQAVLCTSANGVRALARASGERRVPLFAVGDATAARARAEGFAEVTSAGGDAADLVRLAARRLRPQSGGCCTSVAARSRATSSARCAARGFASSRAVLYEARPVPALSPAAVRGVAVGQIDLALFFSPRTAAIFARLAEEAVSRRVARRRSRLSRSVPRPMQRSTACHGASGGWPTGPTRGRCSPPRPPACRTAARLARTKGTMSEERGQGPAEDRSEAPAGPEAVPTPWGASGTDLRRRGRRHAGGGRRVAAVCWSGLLVLVIAGVALSPFWAPARTSLLPWGARPVAADKDLAASLRGSSAVEQRPAPPAVDLDARSPDRRRRLGAARRRSGGDS